MKKVFDVCYNENEQYLDIYLPENQDFFVFIYFHGGSLEAGDKRDDKILFEYLVSQEIAVVSANYRMYPEFKYPDFLFDAADVTAWVFKNIEKYGKIKGIYIGGSSAGAYISQMLCFDKRWLSSRGIMPTDISGFIHDAGKTACPYNVLREKGVDLRRLIIDDTASLYHVGEDEQYSPMLIIVSDNDIPYVYELTMLLISVLKNFGHSEKVEFKVMNGTHCAYVNAVDKNGESVFGKMIKNFIEG